VDDAVVVQMLHSHGQLGAHKHRLDGGNAPGVRRILQEALQVPHTSGGSIEHKWRGIVLDGDAQNGEDIWMRGLVEHHGLLEQEIHLQLAGVLGHSLDQYLLAVVISAAIDSPKVSLLDETGEPDAALLDCQLLETAVELLRLMLIFAKGPRQCGICGCYGRWADIDRIVGSGGYGWESLETGGLDQMNPIRWMSLGGTLGTVGDQDECGDQHQGQNTAHNESDQSAGGWNQVLP